MSAVLIVLALRPAASRRGGCEASALSTRFQSAVSPERSGSRRDSQSAADSDFGVLNSATQEAVRSSATPLDCAELADSAGCSELSDSAECSELSDSG